ncbi:uncharacterized protein LOC134531312 [Bacillus rossius redtenbacheri]|uniref:uncharacterized protein LOC134531312 n=1 Tax=Bacillus rossius redtenbacheri TaxID=93214 RepID=UPI002FDD2142
MMAPWSLLLIGLALTASVGGLESYEESPTVEIPQGTLRGAVNSTADGTKYFKFLGIPYAKPPVGNLRFAAPQDPESWSGVREATSFRSNCVDRDGNGAEDCLFINVYTPQLPMRSEVSLLPVMVYIHGGAFTTGSGNRSPGQLLNYGVVVVSVIYRLSVFGFLSLNGTDAPGNAGLKDQAAALRWVQKNIAKFGGDPKNVTIFGESAGGASVHYHILSPLSKGLFHRAISESGSARDPWAYVKNTEERAYRLGTILGVKPNSSTDLLQHLRSLSVSQLTSGVTKVLTAEESVRPISYPFVPSLEFPRSGEQPFLPHEPAYIEQHGLFNQVPYITGVTKREAGYYVTPEIISQASYWQGINDDLEQVVPLPLGLAKGSQKSKEVAQKVKSFYFGNKTISRETSEQWIALQTDLLFVTGVMQTMRCLAKHSNKPIYNYQFVYGVATHAMEYQFVVYDGKMQGENSSAVKLARLLGSLWTSFARTGAPSVEGGVEWKPVTQRGSSPYLKIDISLSLEFNLEEDRVHFWDEIYKEYLNTNSSFQRLPFADKMATWSLLLFSLFAVSTGVGGQQSFDDSPTVKLPQGTLRGGSTETADGTKYYRFLGIPYARPPVGNLRFAAPKDPEPWSGVRNATQYGDNCAYSGTGSEDCLYVDVFTPQLPTSRGEASLLPVMVYIHGGGFVGGTARLSPGQLLNYGLVVVQPNYRLGVFGFLSVNGTDAPGNAGLKDQSAALRWVQKNIAKFGGDPNNVTIFGMSAGGASIHYHILSPMSKGLFHRAISESGSALNPWAFIRNTEARAYRLGAMLGSETNNATALLQTLRAASTSELTSTLAKILTAEETVRSLSYPFVPSLEFPRSGEQPFLPHEPAYIEQHGLFNQVPYIAGVTKRESASFVTEKMMSQASYWQGINNDLEQVVPVALGLAKGSQNSKEVAQKVKSFYFGNKAISYENRELWISLQTDLSFVRGVTQTVHTHAKHSACHTYNYQFVYGNATHGMEKQFVVYDGKMLGENSDEVKLARILGGLWTSFAKTGVPSVEGVAAWKPVTSNGSYPYLEISLSPILKYNLEKEHMDFWDNIYKEYSNTTYILIN